MEEGGVSVQVCAVFVETKKGSSLSGEAQINAFCELPISQVLFYLAIENASALLEEEEPISSLFERLDAMPTPVYVSLTWNGENRFGGGNATTVGLKKDGRFFLDLLDGKNIALDLSHTSDQLAFDALNHIDTNGLSIPIIASHSNARSIKDMKRNLPDELLSEIIRRKGIIGMNGITHFLGKEHSSIVQHIEHILSLGGENAIACGADFFGGITTPMQYEGPYFFETFSSASQYQKHLELIENALGKELTEKMANKNGKEYLFRTNHKEFPG